MEWNDAGWMDRGGTSGKEGSERAEERTSIDPRSSHLISKEINDALIIGGKVSSQARRRPAAAAAAASLLLSPRARAAERPKKMSTSNFGKASLHWIIEFLAFRAQKVTFSPPNPKILSACF
jgi:hypothetical protein